MVSQGNHLAEGGGLRGRPTSPSPPTSGWVGGSPWPIGQRCWRGETLTAFLCLFEMSDPPKRKSYFLLQWCFVSKDTGEYTGREVWHKVG